MVTDDAFKQFAEQVEREEHEKLEKKTTGGFSYEKIKWSGLPKKGAKVLRALGEAPNSGVDVYTSRTYRQAKIKADNGKEIRVVLPDENMESDHIMWRIINRVMEIEWVDKKRIYVNELRHPDIFNMVKFNNLPEGSDAKKYTKGWVGQDLFVMNCIDRDPIIYAWSKENKHTVLLSKNVDVVKTPEGNLIEFPVNGIPAYGFVSALASNLFKHYGDWRNYDICVERTGLTTSPYRLTHAFKHIEEVPANLQSLVVNGPLTEEELSWEMYDLDKLFKVSSYTKIYNRLQKSIAKIDLTLGTNYVEELKHLSEEEQREWKERKEEDVDEETSEETDNTETVSIGVEVPADFFETPVPQTATVTMRTVRQPSAKPKGYDKLTPEYRGLITKMTQVEADHWEIEYNTTKNIVGCSICHTPSPDGFPSCPGCGADF